MNTFFKKVVLTSTDFWTNCYDALVFSSSQHVLETQRLVYIKSISKKPKDDNTLWNIVF